VTLILIGNDYKMILPNSADRGAVAKDRHTTPRQLTSVIE